MFFELRLHCGGNTRGTMANIQAPYSAGEVNEPIAINILYRRIFGARSKNWRGIGRSTWNCCFAPGHQRA